jgi:hypothetical protein
LFSSSQITHFPEVSSLAASTRQDGGYHDRSETVIERIGKNTPQQYI